MTISTYLIAAAVDSWAVFCRMAPYLLFGFAMAGVLAVVFSRESVERHLGSRGFWSIFKASLLGVPIPLCSCSVIPVATSLRKSGASKGAVTSFFLSAPQTGVDSIFATWSLLGTAFAVMRPLVAFVSGILGGLAVDLTSRGKRKEVQEGEDNRGCCCSCSCSSHSSGQEVRSPLARIIEHGFFEIPSEIGRPLVVGVLISGVITALVPDDFFGRFLHSQLFSMLAMLGLGIPIYVCATASIPLAAAFMAKGLSAGAALVFLMSGPATNAATVTTLWHLLGPKSAICYLMSVAVTALASGYLFDLFFARHPELAEVTLRSGSISAVETVSALILLALLVAAHLRGRRCR